MAQTIEMQSRNKSVLFWVGLFAAIYQAVYGSLTANAEIVLSPTVLAIMGSISVALSALLVYCNGNNPSLTIY
ncbi:MAG: hypothetical protein J6Z35_11985 [Lachnospiraceae bacterium]|nr:hypothetical protein [Lachnospiraceae bacterium]